MFTAPSRRRWPHLSSLLPALVLVAACGGPDAEPTPSPTPDETPEETPETTAPDLIDLDQDGYLSTVDCNDLEPSIHPGAEEMCDGVDNDCDEDIDPSTSVDAHEYYPDQDEDGFGDPEGAATVCIVPDGYVEVAEDCDDEDYFANPNSLEVCDGADNDCDGTTDGPGAGGALTYFEDGDRDGYGDAAQSLKGCELPAGYVANDDDCDDSRSDIYPGAPEGTICDGLDQDCDRIADDGLDCEDGDGDGYSEAQGDCNDSSVDINPDAEDLTCDGIDQDCSGIDHDLTCQDNDSDGYNEQAGDCDDTQAGVYPGSTEVFDGLDNDCDGIRDEGVIPVGAVIVTEIHANPTGEDGLGEWLEVYNTTPHSINLAGWAFKDNTPDPAAEAVIGFSVELEPGHFALLGNCGDVSLNGGITLNYAYASCSTLSNLPIALGNSPSAAAPEYIRMYDASGGRLIDEVTYSDSAREALSRQLDPGDFDSIRNDASTAGEVWCYKTASPGTMNVSCP